MADMTFEGRVLTITGSRGHRNKGWITFMDSTPSCYPISGPVEWQDLPDEVQEDVQSRFPQILTEFRGVQLLHIELIEAVNMFFLQLILIE